MRRDNLNQRQEIEKHKWLRSEREGRDIGGAVAAGEWCAQFAHVWRAEHESLERNGFIRLIVVIRNPAELHLSPVSNIGKLATQFDCDIYVHKLGVMPYYNFVVEEKPYMNVKSILGFLSLGLAKGDTLEFVAAGSQAPNALEAIRALLGDESGTTS